MSGFSPNQKPDNYSNVSYGLDFGNLKIEKPYFEIGKLTLKDQKRFIELFTVSPLVLILIQV